MDIKTNMNNPLIYFLSRGSYHNLAINKLEIAVDYLRSKHVEISKAGSSDVEKCRTNKKIKYIKAVDIR